ncbi:MAG: 3'-5' exonuclease domain-containing protein 2 [Bacteroidales bacterium]|nr:MAG: 3'-5' exonuclease domain-containing protein 2 [Bacteroidales bacterium]
MFRSSITREEVRRLPQGRFEGEVVVIDRDCLDPGLIRELTNYRILGFDTETRPSFKKGRKNKVALLQLATARKTFLIRCNQVGLPEPLAKILESPDIVKVGVAIRDDIKGLQQYADFKPAGFIDLQKYVNRFGIESNGLRNIAAIVLNIKVSKSQQLSNWENEYLSDAQILYAATDAWVCHQIYTTLLRSGYDKDDS